MATLDSILDPLPFRFDVSTLKSALPPASQKVARKNVMNAIANVQAKGVDPYTRPVIIDVDGSKGHFCSSYSPCLTASRSSGHWVTNRGRRLSLSERLRLMGVRLERVQNCIDCASERDIGKVIGNAVPVSLISNLFRNLLPVVGLPGPGLTIK